MYRIYIFLKSLQNADRDILFLKIINWNNYNFIMIINNSFMWGPYESGVVFWYENLKSFLIESCPLLSDAQVILFIINYKQLFRKKKDIHGKRDQIKVVMSVLLAGYQNLSFIIVVVLYCKSHEQILYRPFNYFDFFCLTSKYLLIDSISTI